MKKSGKTILYVIITISIITIVILIGIIFNLLEKNKIIDSTETSGKQLTETTSSNAYVGVQTHLSEVNAQEEKLLAFKSTIATAITHEGVTTSSTDTESTMASNIANILKTRTTLSEEEGATADNISEGKKAWVNGELIIGNGADNIDYRDNLISQSVSKAYTIPAQYGTTSVKFTFSKLSKVVGIKGIAFSGAEVGSNSAVRSISISGNTCTVTFYYGYVTVSGVQVTATITAVGY